MTRRSIRAWVPVMVRVYFVLGCLFTAASLNAQPLPALGELAVSEALLVFAGHTRTQELSVQNTGKVRATYRLSFQHLRMTEQGGLEEVSTFPTSAAAMLRFSPHQVELEPGEIQKVRVQVRKPEHLEDGDYRIHLLFRAMPPPQPEASLVETPQAGVQIQLTAIPGVAVPIHILHGQAVPTFRLDDVQVAEGSLRATLVQMGKVGVRGKLVLLGGKKERELGSADVVHYADLPRQLLSLLLPTPLPPGTLRLQLRDPKDKILLDIQIPRA